MPDNIKIFSWGILGALGALVLESIVAILFQAPLALTSQSGIPWLMGAGVFIEEALSLILIGKFFQKTSIKNNFLVNTLFFGIGFSLPEIAFNILSSSSFSENIILSYLGLFLIHTATASIFGYYFSKYSYLRIHLIFFFILAIFSHLTFNLLVLSNSPQLLILSMPLFIIFLCFLAQKMRTE